MKKQILVLSGLLIGSQSLSGAMTTQKQVTRTQEEHYQLNRQFVEATNAGDTDRIKALLKEGALRDTHTYRIFPFYAIRAPHEVAMSVLEQLEEYFNLQEDIQATVQGNTTTDSSTGQTNRFLESFRDYLEHQRIDQQLTRSAKEGNAPLTKELMKKLALRCYGLTPFICAALQGHTEILDSILDAFENDPPLMERIAYRRLSEVNADRESIVRLFQRDVRNLDDQMGCLEKIRHYCESSSLEHAKFLIGIIAESIKVNLSRDIIFTFFSAHNDSLRLSLKAIGAQQLTHSPALRVNTISKQEHLNRLLLFAVREDDELMKALIDEGADVSTVDDMKRTPLHLASYHENIRAAQILLRAGAPIDALDSFGVTPLYISGRIIRPGVPKLLLESGATLEDNDRNISFNDAQETIKTILEASVRRCVPTQTEAKVALQNVAFLFYFLGTKCSLPFYVIHEIICFATGAQNVEGRLIAPEWTQRLKRDLEVLYLYKCNGNRLLPLWVQTITCIAKDPQEQSQLISRLGGYVEPFLANDTKRLVCLRIMNKVAAGKRILVNKLNTDEILVDNFKLYFEHLDKYLQMSGFDEE